MRFEKISVIVVIVVAVLATLFFVSEDSETVRKSDGFESATVLNTKDEAGADITDSEIDKTQQMDSASPNKLIKVSGSNDTSLSAQFSSVTALNTYLFDDEGAIYSKNINRILTGDDFTAIIEQISSMEDSEKSIEREMKLISRLNELRANNVYAEEYACRGDICAVTFLSDNKGDVNVTSLGEFDSNYTFENTTENEFGEKVVKAVFILTDDPSTLSLNNG